MSCVSHAPQIQTVNRFKSQHYSRDSNAYSYHTHSFQNHGLNKDLSFFTPTWVRSCSKDIKCAQLQFKNSSAVAILHIVVRLSNTFPKVPGFLTYALILDTWIMLHKCCTRSLSCFYGCFLVDWGYGNGEEGCGFRLSANPMPLAGKAQRRVTAAAKSPTHSLTRV